MGHSLQKHLPFGDDTRSGAEISECGEYRYRLWRFWSDRPAVCFVMLNPSTADAVDDDRTVSRCMAFARSWGAGGIYVANLFALRSTDPQGLLSMSDPVGRGNNDHIADLASRSRIVVCAWGTHSGARLQALIRARAKTVCGVLKNRRLMCLGTAKDGSPRHPLYLAADTKLVQWSSK